MKRKHAGFTLLEMIASLGVFSVVIVIFSSTFLHLLNAERKTQIAATVQDNLRFALETMAKDIRTGTVYYVDNPDTDSTVFGFTNTNGASIKYCLNGLCGNTNPCSVNRCIGRVVISEEGAEGEFLPITSDQITIDKLRFYLKQDVSAIQPSVIIAISARATIQNIETRLNVETLVSQRKVIKD